MTRRIVGFAVAAMAVVLVCPAAALAHSLTVADVVAKIRPYAQRVADDPQVGFTNYRFSCPPLYPHQRKCTVNYDNPQTRADEAARQAAWVCPRLPGPVQPPCGPRRPTRIAPWACTEQLLIYYQAHSPYATFIEFSGPLYMKHVSTPCGRTRVLGPSA